MQIRTLLAAAAMAAALPAVAHATPGVTFLIDGNTASSSYSFTNTSLAGQKLTAFGFDLSTIPAARPGSRIFFDTNGGGQQFYAQGGTGSTTGLLSSPLVPDEAQAFELGFNDFDVGETFRFLIDIDSSSTTAVWGDDLIGASVWFMFDNKTKVEGKLYAVAGKPNAAQFVTDRITSAVPEPATWAMMITGFGMAGSALRRRRTTAAVA